MTNEDKGILIGTGVGTILFDGFHAYKLNEAAASGPYILKGGEEADTLLELAKGDPMGFIMTYGMVTLAGSFLSFVFACAYVEASKKW